MTDEMGAAMPFAATGKLRAAEIGRANLAAGREFAAQQRRLRIAVLAELLAEDVPVKHAATVIGVSETAAHNMLGTMRRELGWQAR